MKTIEVYQLEEIMEIYVLIKENKASVCQVNDCYYLIYKTNVPVEQRIPKIREFVENNYSAYYQMAVKKENMRNKK